MAAPKNNCFNPNGAPKAKINWNLFEELCALQCTQDEIARILEINDDTLRDRTKENYGDDYSTIYKRFSSTGKMSLRRNQFVLSKKNAAMAIWLGKQWLDQRDNAIENKVNDEVENKYLEVMQQLLSLQSLNRSSPESSSAGSSSNPY